MIRIRLIKYCRHLVPTQTSRHAPAIRQVDPIRIVRSGPNDARKVRQFTDADYRQSPPHRPSIRDECEISGFSAISKMWSPETPELIQVPPTIIRDQIKSGDWTCQLGSTL